VLRKRKIGYRATPQPLFRNEAQPACAPPRGRRVADGLAIVHDGITGHTAVLARQRGEQLLLAVARHASHPEDLALVKIDTDVIQGGRKRMRTRQAEPTHRKYRAPRRTLVVPYRRRLAADHHARKTGVGFLPRVADAGDLASTHHRALVTQ